MPDIEAFLHYRSVDVSSVKELCKRWYPTVTIDRPSKAGAHRALNDILESVRELRFYREIIFTASPGGNGPTAPAHPAAND
jgi:oligoribonuclease